MSGRKQPAAAMRRGRDDVMASSGEAWQDENSPTFEPTLEHVDPDSVVVDVEEARRPRSDNAKAIASLAKGAAVVEAIKSKRAGASAVHDLNPYDLYLQAGWNMRNFKTPARRLRIAKLAANIAENGVREVMHAHIKGDKIYIHSGWNRLLATYHAIENGAEVRGVPVRFGRAGEGDADRMMSQIINNDQDPLLLFEHGRVLKQMVDFGWSMEQIARKAGRSVSNVNALLQLLEWPVEIQRLVEDGVVSPYFAAKSFKESKGDPEKTLQVLHTAINNAREEGSERVMPKHTRKLEERTSNRKSRKARAARRDPPEPLPSLPSAPVVMDETVPRIKEILRNARIRKHDEGVIMDFSVVDFNDLVVLAELPDVDDDLAEPASVPTDATPPAEAESAADDLFDEDLKWALDAVADDSQPPGVDDEAA